MKVKFLGTRGNIEERTRRHYMHSSLMVSYHGKGVMIDGGEDWLGKVKSLHPLAIVLTHAHSDHSWGLKKGVACPVYATRETWERLEDFQIDQRLVVEHREPIKVQGIDFEAFRVEHSARAPAVGYRISAGKAAIFYVPDVVYVYDCKEALSGVQVYVGDGATIVRSMVRQRDNTLIGHTPIRTQLDWCKKENVSKAIFTHCGSQIVKGDERKISAKIRQMGKKCGVDAGIAHDGMEVVIRG
jgi:phosphoribosyl 1,2-cyclic phosphodiesterase